MTGCPDSPACRRACWEGEESQQPMWPQAAHRRRWNHHPPVASHSTQPGPLGGTDGSIAAVVSAGAQRPPDLPFTAVDLPAEPGLAAAVGVKRAPSLMVFRDGVPVFAEPGWFPEDSMELLIATVRELDMVAVRETFPEPVHRS